MRYESIPNHRFDATGVCYFEVPRSWRSITDSLCRDHREAEWNLASPVRLRFAHGQKCGIRNDDMVEEADAEKLSAFLKSLG